LILSDFFAIKSFCGLSRTPYQIFLREKFWCGLMPSGTRNHVRIAAHQQAQKNMHPSGMRALFALRLIEGKTVS
jgi:hypothetical protein